MERQIPYLLNTLAWLLLGGLGVALTVHTLGQAAMISRWLGALP